MDYNTCVVDGILKIFVVLLVHWITIITFFIFLKFLRHVIMCKMGDELKGPRRSMVVVHMALVCIFEKKVV